MKNSFEYLIIIVVVCFVIGLIYAKCQMKRKVKICCIPANRFKQFSFLSCNTENDQICIAVVKKGKLIKKRKKKILIKI